MTQEAIDQTPVTRPAVPGDWAGSFSHYEEEHSTSGRGAQEAGHQAARGDFVPVRQRTATQVEWFTSVHIASTPIAHEPHDSDWTWVTTLTNADWGDVSPEGRDEVSGATEEREKEIERIAAGRIELLARRYAESFGREELARLAMLSEKLDVLLPRITPEEYEALEEIAERARKSVEVADEIAKRYGID